VHNTGDVPISNVAIKADLPAEVAFSRATNGGKVVGKQVVWALATLAAREERTITVTAISNKPTDRAVVSASAAGTLTGNQDGGRRGSSTKTITAEPAKMAFAVVGAPALQLSVKDSVDPARVGQQVTYTIRVTNKGTQTAQRIAVVAWFPGDIPAAKPGETAREEPRELRPVRGTGPGAAATISEQRVVFPTLESLAPNAEATFVVEAEARIPGEGRLVVEVRSASQAQPLRAVEPTKIISSETRPFDR
jgi:uncharacterized repeat protein (TIGR01451 family)